MARVDHLLLNGIRRPVDADSETSLLTVLRDHLGLTGSKYGCGEGQCGACTVLLEGRTARSCITPMRATAGNQVTTIEGLERDGKLHSLQEAFLEEDALQCGYCTPGMIVAGLSLLRQNGNPSEQEVIHAMDGNVCRCGAYTRIVRAIQKAAVRMKGSAK